MPASRDGCNARLSSAAASALVAPSACTEGRLRECNANPSEPASALGAGLPEILASSAGTCCLATAEMGALDAGAAAAAEGACCAGALSSAGARWQAPEALERSMPAAAP